MALKSSQRVQARSVKDKFNFNYISNTESRFLRENLKLTYQPSDSKINMAKPRFEIFS